MGSYTMDESLIVPVSDIKKRQVMDKRENVNKEIALYYLNGESDAEELRPLRSALISLFHELGDHVSEFYGIIVYTEIKRLVYDSKSIKLYEEAYTRMDKIISDIIERNKEPLL